MKKSIIVLLMSLILTLSGCDLMEWSYNNYNSTVQTHGSVSNKKDLNYVLDCGFIKNIQVEFNQKFPLYISGMDRGEYVITNVVPTFRSENLGIFLDLNTTVKCIKKSEYAPSVEFSYKWYDNNGNVHASETRYLTIDYLKLESGEQGERNVGIWCTDIKEWDRDGHKIQIYMEFM